MKRESELLYWRKYKYLIHYNEKEKKYEYDKELPTRAHKSFEAWLKQFNK